MNGGATGLVSIVAVDRASRRPAVKPQAGPVNVRRDPQDSCILIVLPAGVMYEAPCIQVGQMSLLHHCRVWILRGIFRTVNAWSTGGTEALKH